MEEITAFDCWCNVEVSCGFVRIDVPAVGERMAFTKLIGTSSIYAMTRSVRKWLGHSLRSTASGTLKFTRHQSRVSLMAPDLGLLAQPKMPRKQLRAIAGVPAVSPRPSGSGNPAQFATARTTPARTRTPRRGFFYEGHTDGSPRTAN